MTLRFEVPAFIKPALYNNAKYSVITSGRRTGKTYNAVQWLLEKLLTDPKAKAGLHVDTTQSNLTAYLERYYRPILKPIWHLCHWNGQRYILSLPGNKYIDFGSSQKPENLEGFEYDYAILNEAGIILRKESLWYESLEPMFQHAKVRIVGTPKGKNLFHKLYTKGKEGHQDYKSFQFSSYNSPFVNDKVIEEARKTLPEEVFRQNYLAEFIEGAGSVFRNITNCIREPQPNLKCDILGIDLAKHEDFTVITAVNQQYKQVIEVDRFNQIDWSFQKNRIVAMWERLNKPMIIIDSTGVGDPVLDDLRAFGMNIEGYKFTNSSKAQLIQSLSLSMDKGEIFFPNKQELISELEIFGYDMTSSGNITYNAPQGFHDDMVISLALANYKMNLYQEISLTWI